MTVGGTNKLISNFIAVVVVLYLVVQLLVHAPMALDTYIKELAGAWHSRSLAYLKILIIKELYKHTTKQMDGEDALWLRLTCAASKSAIYAI